jgi:hypothetical protein
MDGWLGVQVDGSQFYGYMAAANCPAGGILDNIKMFSLALQSR